MAENILKSTISISISIFVTLILGAYLLKPVNSWYWEANNLQAGKEAEMEMVRLFLFVEAPILILIGAVVGYLIYKKFFKTGPLPN